MNRKERYNKTVDILFDAYHQGKIRYGCCARCAGAHIIASNMGYTVYASEKWDKEGSAVSYYYWVDVLRCPNNFWSKIKLLAHLGLRLYKLQHKLLASTGYTVAELLRMERTFESYRDSGDVSKGLKAVLEVLKDIHEITSENLATGNNKQDENLPESITDSLVRRHQSLSKSFII